MHRHGRPVTSLRHRLWRVCLRAAATIACLAGLGLLAWFAPAIYRHCIRYPREARAWAELRAQLQQPPDETSWPEFRGILHAHSHLSHDSEVPFETVLAALQQAGLDFIVLADHCVDGRADFSLQWRGLHAGRLFIPGYEMRLGFHAIGVSTDVILRNDTDNATLARQIVEHGGLLFFVHPEEPRDWDRPELTGMEIYNLHTDFKQLRGGLWWLLPELLLNLHKYPDHIYHRLCRRPVAFLERWDQLNLTRSVTGVAGNDCHQNVGLRIRVGNAHTLALEEPSPRVLRQWSLTPFQRTWLERWFGPLEPGRILFQIQLDPYERCARFVNTHLLARELSEPALREALQTGRAFVAFNHLVDATGFRWFARSGSKTVVMGETVPYTPEVTLHARAPVPCRFTILRHGRVLHQALGRELDWTPPGPGKYRVEAELQVLGRWVPWIYANPITLLAPASAVSPGP